MMKAKKSLKKTTAKEEQWYIAGRNRNAPPRPPVEGRGKEGGNRVADDHISRSPIETSGDTGREGSAKGSHYLS